MKSQRDIKITELKDAERGYRLLRDDLAELIERLIQAEIITDGLGGLAVKDSVDLSTAEVTNKSLANLDSTASAKLNTIEEGADVTADNTAAAITGQGALATKSSVDLTTSEVTNKSLANLDSTANSKLSGIEAGADVTATSIAFTELEARVTALEGSW